MKRLSILLFAVALAVSAAAQTTVKVNVPNLVAVDEQFNLTFIIEGEHAPSDFKWTPSEDFQLVWGPQKGTSTSVSIINGKTTRSSQTTYTYVLMPKRSGTFRIEPAVAKVKGDEFMSKAASVQVVSNQPSQSQGQSRQSSSGQQEERQDSQARTGTIDGEDLFMRLSLSKTKVVVGETVTATLKLYQRVNIAGFEDAKFPDFNGFWSQEVQAPQNIEFHRESIGDVIYNAAVLRSWTLIPQQAGDITVNPAELVCLVNVRAPRSSSGSIFDSFFQDDYRTIRKRVTTPAYTVHVSKVPAGAPASFGGGVGSFRMSAALTRDSLQTHDAASLKITVTGKGNLSLLEAPKVDFPPDFEVYDVKVSETAGSRTFEYPFIPRSHGDFMIGPVEYSYYDVSASKYVTLTAAEMPLKVSRGAEAVAETGGTLVPSTVRKDVKDLNRDIRSISSVMPSLRRKGDFFVCSAGFTLILVFLVLAAVSTLVVFRRIGRRRADVVGTKNRGAVKMARKRLARAGEFLSKDLYTAFYEELHKALLGFVSDKLNMNASEMSRENICSRLRENGVPEKIADEFVALIDACEYARYAPSEGHEAMNAHYESAVSVISTIGEGMKKNSKSGTVAAALLVAMMLPLSRPASAQDAGSLWAAGVEAYGEGRWSDAADAWNAVAVSGLESSELYYNLGNAYFRASEYGRAILNYERALKIDPSNGDAAFNLEYASTMVQDRIEEIPEFFVKTWLRSLCRTMSSNAWAVLFLILFAAALAMGVVFALATSSSWKKTGFWSGIVLALVAALCLSMSLWQRSEYESGDYAIVLSPVASVKSSPYGDSSKDLFILHEGAKTRVLEVVGDWSNIELSDGRQGWIKSSSVELI